MDDSREEVATVKLKAIPQPNEKEKARYDYDQALKRMNIDPSEDNVAAFERANKHLYEVEDAYRIGARLLMERAQRVWESVSITRLFANKRQ